MGGWAPGLVPDRWTAIKKGQVHLDLAVVGKTAVLPKSRRVRTIDAAFPSMPGKAIISGYSKVVLHNGSISLSRPSLIIMD